MNEAYELISIEPAEAPANTTGSNWCRYQIGQGTNRIYGFRQGDLPSITESIEELVLRLNERRGGKLRRVHLQMSNSVKPQAAK
ncbi:MAG: hypothetical protein OEW35_17225 [Gammaproteobacteria bacterium]|nr:hypothetical protein [Gammaproteobacteria bacterium]MDH4255226.1 hypothetical protein [Gammaproteobacteria bacterium]MDH5310882.1 hypothetical protein [Gammaproteobacteria bacterium]